MPSHYKETANQNVQPTSLSSHCLICHICRLSFVCGGNFRMSYPDKFCFDYLDLLHHLIPFHLIHRWFVSWKSACDVNPCHNKSTCQSGFTEQRYRCVCAPGFTGEDCGRGKNTWIENDFVFLPFLITPLPEGCCWLRIILRASFDFICFCWTKKVK